ncbi:hypothetical protein Prum_013370 [Phytohabitans rumicis]|uniref:Chromosome condensation regulator n=1 Tax=Phytohabitans rumicis TaxID=1076125 RepID=A0A6V8L4X3_9ACTN|nr:hypothetical protein Prum_013370 [Phytohabitans rumicis]
MAVPLIAVLALITGVGAWLVPAAGAATTSDAPTLARTAAPVIGPPSVADRIDAGLDHTCVVDDDDAVRCWGRNDAGQLGHGDNATLFKSRIGDDETPESAGPVDLNGVGASMVSAGDNHSCAILVDATVACWGQNLNGTLGSGAQDPLNGAIGDDEVPGAVRVNLGANRTAKAIAAGGRHTCVITDRDKVMCWGNGNSGELGYGDTDDIGDGETPADAGTVDLGAGRDARSIAAGGQHVCALMDNGNIFCWGDNSSGQLGYPGVDAVGDNETPFSVGTVDLGATKALTLTAGLKHTCAKLDNDKLRCWGSGHYGAIGSGSADSIGLVQPPDTGHVDLRDIDTDTDNVSQAGAGEDHTCAVLSGAVHTVLCWGREGDGRLGQVGLAPNNNIGDDEAPAVYDPIDLGGDSIVAVTAGDTHTCAVTVAGQVRCWGSNRLGAVGHAGGDWRDIGDDETPGSINPIVLGATVTVCPRILCP